MLSRELSGKVSKKFFGNFSFWENTIRNYNWWGVWCSNTFELMEELSWCFTSASFSKRVLVPVATVSHLSRTRVRCVLFQPRLRSLMQVVDDDWSGRLFSSCTVTLKTTQSINIILSAYRLVQFISIFVWLTAALWHRFTYLFLYFCTGIRESVTCSYNSLVIP